MLFIVILISPALGEGNQYITCFFVKRVTSAVLESYLLELRKITFLVIGWGGEPCNRHFFSSKVAVLLPAEWPEAFKIQNKLLYFPVQD